MAKVRKEVCVGSEYASSSLMDGGNADLMPQLVKLLENSYVSLKRLLIPLKSCSVVAELRRKVAVDNNVLVDNALRHGEEILSSEEKVFLTTKS